MGTADVLRTIAAIREGVGPAGTSIVGGVIGFEEAGDDPSEWKGEGGLDSVESGEDAGAVVATVRTTMGATGAGATVGTGAVVAERTGEV